MRTVRLTGCHWQRTRFLNIITLVALIGTFSLARVAFANENDTIPPPMTPNVVSPGLNLSAPELPAPAPSKPLVRRWWFWTAIGAVTATTIVLIAVSQRDNSPPASLLGNQEFQP